MAKTQTDGKRRKPWWLLGLLIILISVACSAGVYFLLESRGSGAGAESAQAAEPVEPEIPIFVTVKPFTVNIQSDDYSQRLLYIGLSIKVADEASKDLLESHMPQVRSRLLMLLSSQNADDLVTPEGKQRLTGEILALFDKPFSDPQPPLNVDDVLYTDFIVQ
ncbi:MULTISPECIES: flagellar basal body-associated protein FliL [unclassified Modicisalibacter]|uniref:flagellar basal body-associated protein FliL n=1 Tax=unclassified Modicisalibacter TaxID=2679913 RepID=UPI001CCD9224|nr:MULTISPECIES: flagellar basal body-associated protein FliL [unclassified Modicisalibacter]MBZ9556982.1 flagellar basal body-associated protein FliL [Modicisalibacter sp. R2A 31.J]MBZ9574304.1 flagellar basal body-associated protein FliL [Modicisalibacter sp. MOD 31.J]